jgi:hypothetical protein
LKRYTTRERALMLLETRTQKQAAKLLGVSDRTIRRWKNREVERPIPVNEERLIARAARDRERLQREWHRAGHGIRLPPRPRITVRASRQHIKQRDIQGRETGRYRDSEWLALHVHNLNNLEIARLLMQFKDQGEFAFQVKYRVPKGGLSPDPMKRQRPAKEAYTVRSRMEYLNAFEDDTDLMMFFDHIRNDNVPGALRKIPIVFVKPIKYRHY